MHVCHRAASLLALGLLALAAGTARADRVPSARVVTLPSTGSRADITVPYLTNGRSTLGVAQGVGPLIIVSPVLTDPARPEVKPVANLIFYGSGTSFGAPSIGAGPRQPNRLRP
jgi:hypothetical protein